MWYQRRQQSKYKNIRQTYNGYSYMSKREAAKAWELDCLVKAGEIRSWDKQVKHDLYGQNGSHIAKYYVDFSVTHNDGMIELIEIKSPITATEVWRLKWKMLEDKLKDEVSRGEIKLTVEY